MEENIKEQYYRLLCATDSILEPDVFVDVGKFLALGGTPSEVIDALSTSYKGLPEICHILIEWMEIVGVKEEKRIARMQQCIRNIIVEQFDPIKIDEKFSKEHSAPLWLEIMIQQPFGRKLVYELSEKHKNCLLLNFAIQRTSDAGYQSEIARVTTATSYIDIFSKVIVQTITNLIQLNEAEFQEKLPDFIKMCCHTEYTYLYIQILLEKFTAEKNGFVTQRLQQELEIAASKYGPVVHTISILLSNVLQYPKLASAINSILNSRATTTGDILTIYQEYTKENPPTVSFLRNLPLIEIIIYELFVPSKSKINPLHKDKFIFVLAYAVSINETFDQNGKMVIDKMTLNGTIEAITKTELIVRKNPYGHELQYEAANLCTKLEYPIIGLGLIDWIRFNLEDPDYYMNHFTSASTPGHFIILEEIAGQLPLQKHLVFSIFVEAFQKPHDLAPLIGMELKKNILDRMIFLMQQGLVLPVLRYIRKIASEIDEALVTYFTTKVLNMIEPPYSEIFIENIVNIIQKSGLIRTFKTQQESASLLINFIEQCGENVHLYSTKIQESLSKLKESFS